MKTKKIIYISILVIFTTLMFTGCNSNAKSYNEAQAMFNEGNYTEAATAFETLGDYKDAMERAEEAKALIRYILTININELTWTDENGEVFDCPTDGDLWFENADFITASRQTEYGRKLSPNGQVYVADYDNITKDVFSITFGVDSNEYTFDAENGTQFVVNKTNSGGYNLLPEETLAISK